MFYGSGPQCRLPQCPNNETELVTVYINLRGMSPHYSTNALYRQIRHPDLSLQKSRL